MKFKFDEIKIQSFGIVQLISGFSWDNIWSCDMTEFVAGLDIRWLSGNMRQWVFLPIVLTCIICLTCQLLNCKVKRWDLEIANLRCDFRPRSFSWIAIIINDNSMPNKFGPMSKAFALVYLSCVSQGRNRTIGRQNVCFQISVYPTISYYICQSVQIILFKLRASWYTAASVSWRSFVYFARK